MKILGTIKHICDPRTWMSNSGAVTYYPMIFSGEGGEFYGEMRTSKEWLDKRGIKVGAIGHMEIEFRVGEFKRSTGDTYPVQRVTMKNFTLANSGVFTDNVPAASGAEQAAPAAETAEKPAEQAQVEENTQLPF